MGTFLAGVAVGFVLGVLLTIRRAMKLVRIGRVKFDPNVYE
jgi:hypothetical protein